MIIFINSMCPDQDQQLGIFLQTHGVKFPLYSYILLYLKTVLYIPIYSYIWKTVLYIPVYQGKQEMVNSYLKQMLLSKFVILQHLLSNSHYHASYRQRLDNNKEKTRYSRNDRCRRKLIRKDFKEKGRKKLKEHLC